MIMTGHCSSVDVKRLYLPGIVAHANCTTCKKEQSLDMTDNYPWGMEKDGSCWISFYCDVCDDYWEEKAILRINLWAPL